MTAAIDPFHAIAIGELAYELAGRGRSIIHMEYGQPSTGAPAAAIAVAHRVLDADAMGYWENPQLKARIARLYYAASDPKGGAVEHGARVFDQPQCLHRPEIYSGMGEDRAARLLREFFQAKR